jgi:DNA invertase Pin-like site-specific DNA recombinase
MTTSTKPNGQMIGYVRVSTLDQNTERQLEGVSLDKVFTDKASGKDTDRPQLQAALEYVREGDALVCHSMDRLARNLDDLRRMVKELTGKGVAVRFVKESLTFTGDDSPMATLLLSVMGAFAEFERSLIKERQREGIAIAKAKGVYRGRKPALSAEQVETLKAQDKERGGKNRAGLAKEYGISRETLYQYLALQGAK